MQFLNMMNIVQSLYRILKKSNFFSFLIRNNVKKRNWTELELKIMVFLIAIYQIINQKEVNKFNDSDWKNIATHLIDKQYDGVKFKWNSIQKSIPILQEWDSEEDRFITNYIKYIFFIINILLLFK